MTPCRRSVLTGPRPLRDGLTVVICTCQRPASIARLLDSLAMQDRRPDEIAIVDASPDDDTARIVRACRRAGGPASRMRYWRASPLRRGLTRQRNFALHRVRTSLVAFFDDDVVVMPGCVREMERLHLQHGAEVVGVGGVSGNELTAPTRLWKLRRLLRIVPHLEAGRYCRSGMAIPWAFGSFGDGDAVEGDWLPGYGMMWKTVHAREVGFDEAFGGYAQGEDLEFSLRMRARGRLLMASRARLQHLHEPRGRPDPFRLGYMELYNRYHIHARNLANRRVRDIAWFLYAWTLDTCLLARRFAAPRQWRAVLRQVGGRLAAARAILAG